MASVSPPASALPAVSIALPASSRASGANVGLAVSRAEGCEIVVLTLLDANVYRGSPSSPAKYESYRQDPKYARIARGIDHGGHYLSCTWRVRVNGAEYRYKRASHGGPVNGELEPALCRERAEAEATADAVRSFTDGCKDLHKGEGYGDVLDRDGGI